MILHVLIAMIAGWVQRHQQQVIAYLQRRKSCAQSSKRWPPAAPDRCGTPPPRHTRPPTRLEASQRNGYACHPRLSCGGITGSSRKNLTEARTAHSWGGHPWPRRSSGSPSRWPKRTPRGAIDGIQGALANLGHHIDKLTVRNILRRHHMDPAPQRRKGGMGWAQFLKLHWALAATDFFTVEAAIPAEPASPVFTRSAALAFRKP